MALLAKNPADRLRRGLVRLEQPTGNPPRRRAPGRGMAVAAVVAAAVAVATAAPKLELPVAVRVQPPAAKGAKAAPVVGGVRFAPAAVPLVGDGGVVFAVAVSPDGARVAAGGGNGTSGFFVVLDADAKKELFATRLSTAVTSVAYSPDGKHVAYASRGTVRLVAAAGGEKVFELRPGGFPIVCFAPDGRTIATATDKNGVQIWDVPTGVELKNLPVPSAAPAQP